ncbi:hypothetical protein ELAC_0398 [Estrella lausannensis]|uniref:Uncharacterized protein n=2 Tax=Estrella lausannensis TaxID=483423 RepID=A0A0H5DQD2_9BACT|nr:hypothetical protein ELAC_0398 [Estrella lausannensis]
MTPMSRDALFKAIKEGETLFQRLNYFTGRMKEGFLSEKESEGLKALVKEITLYEEQLLRKSYGEDFLILTPLAKTLSVLANSMLLDRGPRSVGFTLAIAFLETGEEGKGTQLTGPSLKCYAKALTDLLVPVFFPGITEGGKKLFDNMALLYIALSQSLGILALGVEREGALDQAADVVKKKVEKAKEVALVYTSLFIQAAMQQRFIDLCFAGEEGERTYGSAVEGGAAGNVAAVLEFAFLSSFIQGSLSTDRKKGEYLFKALVPHLKERAAAFESLMKGVLYQREENTEISLNGVAVAVTELRLAVEKEEWNQFMESLQGFLEALGVDKKGFEIDLHDLRRLIQFLAFAISKEELANLAAIHTGMVTV